MGKIAHLRLTCTKCGKWTNVYVEETGGTGAKIKCEHCHLVFDFVAGMMYDPVAYVQEIPAWARITNKDIEGSSSQGKKQKKWWQFFA